MRLVLVRGGSSKFWAGRVVGSSVVVVFGRIGTAGQARSTRFASAALAKAGLAKLVAEKLGKGYKRASAKAKARPSFTPKRRAALVAIATRLGGAALGKEVAAAADDAARYLKRFSKRYGFDADDADLGDELPWLGMIEGLGARRRLAEVDWKEAGSEVLAQLRSVGGAAARRALASIDETDLDARRTDEALALFGRALAGAELALIQLDKGSDSFALMVSPARDVARLVKLARAAGEQIIRHDGRGLEQLEAERVRKAKKSQTDAEHPWRKLVARVRPIGGRTRTEEVLWEVRQFDEALAEIRRALPSVPARDRPLVEMVLSLSDQPASKIARTTKQPALCLHALFFHKADDERRAYEVFAAAAILARRLRVAPDHERAHHDVISACNLRSLPSVSDPALGQLAAPQREVLAELADRYLDGGAMGSARMLDALLAIEKVGDRRSLPRLVAIPEAVPAERARTGGSYGELVELCNRVIARVRGRGV